MTSNKQSINNSTLQSPLLSASASGDDDNIVTTTTSSDEDEHEHLQITRSTKLYAFCASLNSCNLGYDIGVNTGAGPLLQSSLSLSNFQLEIFFGSLNLFAMIGALSSHYINDKFGRCKSFIVAALIFIVGSVIQSTAINYEMLMVGRAFVGLGVGFGLAVDPIYISEISQASHRGYLVTWSEFAINLGIVFGFVSGLLFATVDENVAWRYMFALGVILPCVVIYLASFVMPESPRWLVTNNREEEARTVLQSVYPEGYNVNMIIYEIKDDIKKEEIAEHRHGWGVILHPSPAYKRMLLVGVGTAIAQQAVGIDAILYFMVFILDQSGITSRVTQMWILVGLGLVKLCVIFVAGLLLDKTGRRPLMIISLLGMSVSFIIVSLSFIGGTTAASETAVIVGLALYLAFFSIGMGPATWTIASEVFPTTIRAKAMSLATFGNRATATIFSSSFLTVANAMGWSPFFIMMAVVCLVILVWIYIYLPETKGRHLEEMTQYFAEITGDTSVMEAERALHDRRGGGGIDDDETPQSERVII